MNRIQGFLAGFICYFLINLLIPSDAPLYLEIGIVLLVFGLALLAYLIFKKSANR